LARKNRTLVEEVEGEFVLENLFWGVGRKLQISRSRETGLSRENRTKQKKHNRAENDQRNED